MPKRDIKKIITGLLLIGLGGTCAVAAFYLKDLGSGVSFQDVTALLPRTQVQENLPPEPEFLPDPVSVQKEEAPKKAEARVNLQSLVAAAETLYPEGEKQNKQGYLWVDRQSSKYIITLGALNGLKPGVGVSIYEGETKIGRAVVELTFDVISYVWPDDNIKAALKGDYYLVVIE